VREGAGGLEVESVDVASGLVSFEEGASTKTGSLSSELMVGVEALVPCVDEPGYRATQEARVCPRARKGEFLMGGLLHR